MERRIGLTSWGENAFARRTCRRFRLAVESLEPRTLLSGLSWAAGTSLPVARGDAAALTTDTGVLLFGGTPASGSASTVLRLDSTSDAWVTTTSLNQGRAFNGAAATGQSGPVTYTSDGAV